MKERDFLVIGGGPAGTSFAAEAAKDATVAVLEEHGSIGLPVQCTGLVAPRVVEMARAESTVLNRLRGAYFHFPGGQLVEVRSPEAKAVVVDRAAFDQVCADRALDAGAELLLGERFLDARFGKGVVARCRDAEGVREHGAKLLVGADGYKSNVARCAGLGGSKDLVRGVQLDLRHRLDEQDMLDVHIGREVAPEFFAWSIPCGDMTRVGLCTSGRHGTPLSHLRPFLARQGLEEERRLRVISGLIPIGPPAQTYADRALIIGDAAGQAKPLSGGGLCTGMVAASCAASTALSCLREDDFSAASLSSYQVKWKAEIGRELDRGFLIRRAYVRLSDRKLEEVGRILSKEEVRDVLSQGDIDFPSALAPQVLRAAPSLLKLAPSFLATLFPWPGARNQK